MNKKIVITGASGLVGTRLTELLQLKGYQVSHIGRTKRNDGGVPTYLWDINKGTIDKEAFADVDTVIHLAGAGVAEKRWTAARKKEILESRTKSSDLLYQTLKKENHSVKTVVSASAIGYYGFKGDEVFTEDSNPGSDFLAQITKQWEEEINKIQSLNIRLVKLRIGIVLSAKGGALKEVAKPVKLGIGSPLGTGRQYLTWIHIDDLCNMFIKAVEDQSMHGAYNAVGPQWVTNKELTQAIAKVLHKPLWLPAVPAFLLKLLLGEMANIVLDGSKVSNKKIEAAGYRFQFTKLEDALKNLLQTR